MSINKGPRKETLLHWSKGRRKSERPLYNNMEGHQICTMGTGKKEELIAQEMVDGWEGREAMHFNI